MLKATAVAVRAAQLLERQKIVDIILMIRKGICEYRQNSLKADR